MFPGRCERCGSELVWSQARGSCWTACIVCAVEQLELFGQPTLYAKGEEFADEHWEPPKEGGVVPSVGGAASDEDEYDDLPF